MSQVKAATQPGNRRTKEATAPAFRPNFDYPELSKICFQGPRRAFPNKGADSEQQHVKLLTAARPFLLGAGERVLSENTRGASSTGSEIREFWNSQLGVLRELAAEGRPSLEATRGRLSQEKLQTNRKGPRFFRHRESGLDQTADPRLPNDVRSSRPRRGFHTRGHSSATN